MSRFKRTASQPYTLITPYTPLAELEEFLKHNIFAIGVCTSASCFCVFISASHGPRSQVCRGVGNNARSRDLRLASGFLISRRTFILRSDIECISHILYLLLIFGLGVSHLPWDAYSQRFKNLVAGNFIQQPPFRETSVSDTIRDC